MAFLFITSGIVGVVIGIIIATVVATIWNLFIRDKCKPCSKCKGYVKKEYKEVEQKFRQPRRIIY